LGLDRKSRLQQNPERFRLSDAEKQALLYAGPHYRSNRLSDEAPDW
jgi:hypothetical protein